MSRPTRKQLGWLALLSSTALLGAFALLGWRSTAPARDATQAERAAGPTAHAERDPRDPRRRLFWQELARLAREEEAARSANASVDPNPHPHPLSADHQRLYRDVDLLHAADEAIAQQRYAEARRLLAQHHAELPGMSAIEEEGLLLLADCAEQRNAQNVARVEDFYQRNTASTVRRRLRRGCLERAR
jgi:hypothetical protein